MQTQVSEKLGNHGLDTNIPVCIKITIAKRQFFRRSDRRTIKTDIPQILGQI